MEKWYSVAGLNGSSNAAVAIMLLNRLSRPHLRHRLFRWVIGDRPPARPRRPSI